MYCLVQTDDFADLDALPAVPMVDFSDIDRDGMPDMIFYRDSAVYTFFNKYEANSASDTNLCR